MALASEGVILFVLTKVDAFITKHYDLLRNVGKDVKEIKSELDSIRSFLRTIDESTTEPWLDDMREEAYDIEDVLQDFALKLQKKAPGVPKLLNQHNIATRIKDIKNRLHGISDRKNRYFGGSNNNNYGRSSSSQHRMSEEMEEDRRDFSLHIRGDEIVGIEGSMKALEEWLTDTCDSTLQLTSVVGMSGIGKTVLVKQVYDSEIVKRQFDFRVWIKVPRACDRLNDLLKLIITAFCKKNGNQAPQRIESMDHNGVLETISNLPCLKRRYVLVLDDVWHVDTLSHLKNVLPCNGKCGSRMIVTTTRTREAQDLGHVHEVKLLQLPDDYKLLCKWALPPHLQVVPLSSELDGLCFKIAERCQGLPIAIVTIGRKLKKCGTDVNKWKRVYESLFSDSTDSFDVSTLRFSYDGLPPHLKSCLMYFGMFREIKRVRLIQLWIAEGFIEEENNEGTMEEVANDYLNELIGHSMIQVAKRSGWERVKSCSVHPHMHKFLLLNAKKQNFCAPSATSNASNIGTAKIRRLSIYGDDMKNYDAKGLDLSHVRSFFALGTNQHRVEELYSKFYHLKVLDLENASLKNLPESLGKLIFLRYLSLENTAISTLPKSLGKLENMLVLNLKRTFISQLPVQILKLKKLRHLLAYRYVAGAQSLDCKVAVTVPRGIGCLTALQNLSEIQANGEVGILKELGNLTQLRKLRAVGVRSVDGWHICSSIEKMTNLVSLTAKSANLNPSEPLDLEHQFSPPSGLKRLYLGGRLMKLPHWINGNLQQLTRLTLRWSCLENDPFQELHALPALEELTLIEAYGGKSLYCEQIGKGRGFPNLKLLCLDGLHELQIIHLECGAMPKLQKMIIRHCKLLSMVPLGIQYLTKLEDVELFDVSPEFVREMQTEKQYGQALNHNTRIYVHDLRKLI